MALLESDSVTLANIAAGEVTPNHMAGAMVSPAITISRGCL
jgi:hypothetical protein